jgi:hypothetical protein
MLYPIELRALCLQGYTDSLSMTSTSLSYNYPPA